MWNRINAAVAIGTIAAQTYREFRGAKGGPVDKVVENTGRGFVVPGGGLWDADDYLARLSSKEYVLNARVMQEKDVLSLTGTPRQIASQINTYKNYGISYAYGGSRWVDTTRPAGIDKNMIREIVAETVSGITGIPVYVLENEITTTQRRVKVAQTAGDL
jgi:hypothetical protein